MRPAQFIPVLEDMRTIHLLDSYVIRRACAVMRQTINRGDVPVPISVNLSRLDFELCDIFEVVTAAVNEYQIPRDFLYIEITESIMATQDGGMREVIERFHVAGFQIWMDDFGSGYDENGQIQGLVGYFIDKDLLEENDSRGSETKRRDILTGLLNSRGPQGGAHYHNAALSR